MAVKAIADMLGQTKSMYDKINIAPKELEQIASIASAGKALAEEVEENSTDLFSSAVALYFAGTTVGLSGLAISEETYNEDTSFSLMVFGSVYMYAAYLLFVKAGFVTE